MKKWTKFIALLGILAISLSMLSGCMAGRNYSEEMMGNKDGLPKFQKDQEINVPYTGDAKDKVIQTDDPVLAGKCDADGNLLDGSGKVDLNNLGGSSGGGTNTPSEDDDKDNSVNTPSTPDNDGGEDDNDEPVDDLAVFKADESGTKVKLMTQNLRKGNDADDAKNPNTAAANRIYRFQKLVNTYDPDIIASQECDSFWVEGLPQILGSTYSMSYKYRESTGSNEACVVLYKTEKYKLVTKGHFWLSETPNQAMPAGFGQSYPRIAHWVKLEDKATGDKLLVFSTHLGFGYTKDQMVYIRGLFNQVCAQHTDAYPVIMGDFNFSYGSDNYEILTDDRILRNTYDLAGKMELDGHCKIGDVRVGTNNGFAHADGNNMIDFILVQPRNRLAVDYFTILYDQIAVDEKSILKGFVADHFAVLADLRINTDVSYEKYYKNAN